jgi:hypothetical protein
VLALHSDSDIEHDIEYFHQYKVPQRVSSPLTWKEMEFRIFISSETDGCNLNFMKHRKKEMQSET